MTEPRPDLIDALLRSCWLVEAGRAGLLRSWGGDFAPDADGASERADLIRAVMRERGIPVPESVVGPHTAWLRSLCGDAPDQVPLGAAVAQRLGHWTDVYATPYIADPDAFRDLGEEELRFPVPPRHMERDEVYIERPSTGRGRRLAILTDIHIGSAGAEDLARVAVDELNELAPEVVLVPGDITDDGEPDQYVVAHRILEGLDCAYHCVLGNHDAVQRSTREPAGVRLFEDTFGRSPEDRILEVDDLQIALLDSTDPVPSPFPDWDLARGGFRDDAGGVNNGAYAQGQVEALAAKLDPTRPTLIVQHHELQPFPGFPPVMFGVRDEDSAALFTALANHNVVGVVAGHTHRSALLRVGPAGRVPQLEIPALKDWPYAYTLLEVDGGSVRVAVRQIGDRDLVWQRAQHVPPIYLRYVLGPWAELDHTF